MQPLEVTDEQHAFIQRLRTELSEQVVGKYGHVRDQDAVQFLIDNLDGALDVDHDVSFSTAAEIAAEPPSTGLEEISYEEPERAETDGESGNDEPEDAEESGSGDAEDGGSDESGDETADETADGDDSDDGGESDDESSSGAADDDDMLNQMMNLLDTHEDKWEESSSADYRYSVTLPDGSVEHVQTKDDVRALLFKNY